MRPAASITHAIRFIGGIFALFLITALTQPALAQQPPPFVGMGDSLGEGVQSKNAAWQTQVNSYLVWIARKMEVPFVLPYIQSGLLSTDGDVSDRSRIIPYTLSPNMAVAAQKVSDLLRLRADATTTDEIDNETDLVLFHKQGSQMEIAEFWKPPMAACWIGGNDILGTATAFDQLDGSQLTPLAEFEADYRELVQRMDAAGIQTVYANIPDVANIGFLLDRDDLVKFTGSDQGLPAGQFTTVLTMVLIRLGIQDATILQDPNWVLDAQEIAAIQAHTDAVNQIIATEAAAVQAPVVDINSIFKEIVANPPVVGGKTISRQWLGGLFSLDGFHPSNTGQALVANEFIDVMNDAWMLNIPKLTEAELDQVVASDPFVDQDGDGKLRGRFGVGLFETVFFLLGFTGDFGETSAPAARSRTTGTEDWDSSLFEQIVLRSNGDREADQQRVVDLFHAMMD